MRKARKHKKDSCPVCGKPKRLRSKVCGECWDSNKDGIRSRKAKEFWSRPGYKEKMKEIQSSLKSLRSENLKKRWRDPEYRKYMENVNVGRSHSEETKKKISQSHMGKVVSEEARKSMSNGQRGKKLSDEHKRKLSVAAKGRKLSSIHRKRISKDKIKKWQDPKFAKMMGRAWDLKPNKPEKLLFKLLNKLYPREWKFTGDFSFILNGKSPDFANCNGQKKLIELYGDYWHRNDDPQDRIDEFAQFGYKTLVIWENELKNIDKVIKRVNKFMVI